MVSSVVLAKNEEKNIEDCLKTLTWCSEVIVIDDYSDDKTVEKAKRLGVRIYKRRLDGDFAAQRNFGLEKSRGEWVLFVDADERISADLAAEIQHTTNSIQHSREVGFYLKRRDVMWGRELRHGEQGSVKLLRLARKGSGFWERRVHEIWAVAGEKKELKNPIFHYPHQTLQEFLHDVDFHSTLHAQANMEEGKRSSFFKVIFYPPIKFIQNWLFKLGFLDGTCGFLVAAIMSFHSFLGWGKLYLLQKKK